MDFFDLHHQAQPLVLPNAWDVSSALLLVRAGFPAVGTTSLGVAAAQGLVDGAGRTRQATLQLVEALHPLPVALNVDLEDGFSEDPDAVADLVAEIAGSSGVAGVNLEDSTSGRLVAPDRHAAKIAATKKTAPGVFVNARVDTYWLGEDATPEDTLARVGAYVDAGADGVFVPGDLETDVISSICAAAGVPVNVLATPHHTRTQLGEMGVARISTGSLLYRSALQRAVDVAVALTEQGAATGSPPSYAEVQDWVGELDRHRRAAQAGPTSRGDE